MGDALTFYLLKTLWPFDLTLDYGRTPQIVLAQWTGYVSWMIVFAFGIFVWRTREPMLKTAFGIFIVALLPNSGLLPFLYQAISTVADRYAYVPLLGPAMAFAYICERAQQVWRPRLVAVGAVVVLSLLAVQTAFQTLVWSNDITLCTHVLQINPRSQLAHTALAMAFLRSENYEQALFHSRAALTLNPGDALLLSNQAGIFLKKGDAASLVEGIRILRGLLPSQPNDPFLRFRLANALVRQGQPQEAIPLYRRCLQLQPTMNQARKNLAIALSQAQAQPQAPP